MTDARLQSTKPIDDEVPFEDAEDLADATPERSDALVHPAAKQEAKRPDPDIEPSALEEDPNVSGEQGAP